VVACFGLVFTIGGVSASGQGLAQSCLNPLAGRLRIDASEGVSNLLAGHSNAERGNRRDQTRETACAVLAFHLFEFPKQRFEDLRRQPGTFARLQLACGSLDPRDPRDQLDQLDPRDPFDAT